MYQTMPQIQPSFMIENPPPWPPGYEFQQTMAIPTTPTSQGQGQYFYVSNTNPQLTPSPMHQTLQQHSVPSHEMCENQGKLVAPKASPLPSKKETLDSQSNLKIKSDRDSPLAQPLDESADEYIYLHIPKSQMDNLDIKKILPDSEKDEPEQTKDSETIVKTEKSDNVDGKENENEIKKNISSPTPLTPPPSVSDGDLNTSIALTANSTTSDMKVMPVQQGFQPPPQMHMSPPPQALVPVHYQLPAQPVQFILMVSEEVVSSNTVSTFTY